ncbi:MAG: Colicin V production protein [SAR116 cluster bacterium]|jgi:membrane protein required for colicin V production|nr:MAG: CvpA family protein [SAR116 cluster bacterium]CAI8388024.1 MAG: Colicin V production protein [SAR116 cluster bacterium]|tara:strand:+ start:659 stop:1333 length:675 start_codon:yes stop_codon:yes gene_type:complete
MEFTSLNYVDYLAIAILFISAMLSTIRGMTREFLGLVGWFVAIFIAKLSSPVLIPLLDSFISVSSIITPISWIIPFFAAFIVWYVFASVVSPSLSRAGLGALDGGMGVFFGLARGAVIIVLCYLVLVFLFGGEKQTPNVVRESNTARFSLIIINLTKPLLPNSIQNQFDDLSIPTIESDSSNAAAQEQPLADTANQKRSGVVVAGDAQAAKNPVAVTLQERAVD